MQFFSIIGAQRSGSTWLYNMLDEHPEIIMARPVRPEPKFFITPIEYNKGKNYYLEKYFSTKNNFIGEKSTSYIEHPESCKIMLEFFPDAKFLVILRNPVDRAISNYTFTLEHGLETRTIEEVFIENLEPPVYEDISVNPFDYLNRGKYVNYLKPIIDIIGKDKLKIIIYENICNDISIINDVYEFIGCNSKFTPGGYKNKVNTSKSSHITPETRKALVDYYSKYNNKLKIFADISCWD